MKNTFLCAALTLLSRLVVLFSSSSSSSFTSFRRMTG